MLLQIVIFAIVAKLLRLLWLQNFSRFGRCINKIPGPRPYPFIGNLLDYFPANPERIFSLSCKDVRKYGTIYKRWFISLVAVYISDPKDVELVLSNPLHINKPINYEYLQMWLSTGLLTSGGAKWQKRRKILTPAFHFGILQEFIPIFNKEAAKLVKTVKNLIRNDSCIEVLDPVSQFTLLSIAETSMGVKLDTFPQECAEYKKAIYDFGGVIAYRLSRPWIINDTVFKYTAVGKMIVTAVNVLHSFSKNVIEKRKINFPVSSNETSRKKLSMLDLLLQNRGTDIDDEGIREEVDTFMFEGHDTTAIALSFTLLCLANHPAIQQEVYDELITILGAECDSPSYSDFKELTLMEQCIKESLRLFPSVPFIARTVGEDVKTTTGYTIPKGARAYMYIYHIHRNPEYFTNPEKFDPGRFLPENSKGRHPFCYLPFSAGPRNCIGQKYAMLEVKSALCAILKEFILEPVDRFEDVVFMTDLVLRSKHKVRVQFKLRNKK